MSEAVIDRFSARTPESHAPVLLLGSSFYQGLPGALTAVAATAPTLHTPRSASSSLNGLVLAGRAVGSNDLKIYRWSGSAYVLQTITGATPGGGVLSVAGTCISDDGTWVVAVGEIANVMIYKYDGTGYTLTTTIGIGASQGCVFSPTGLQLAINSGAFSNYVTRVYDFNITSGAVALAALTPFSTGDGHASLDWVGGYLLRSGSTGVTRGDVLNAASLARVCFLPPTYNVSTARWNATGSHIYYRDGSAATVSVAAFSGGVATDVNYYALAASDANQDVIVNKARTHLLVINGSVGNNYFGISGAVLSALTAPTPANTSAYCALFTGLAP